MSARNVAGILREITQVKGAEIDPTIKKQFIAQLNAELIAIAASLPEPGQAAPPPGPPPAGKKP